ncbi:MAG: bifunctional diaminohydroxyphosphoribosylaminopyrimidine deaminase/5-amino-6-(5-phosphoribosylamino)uracil reductase RibD [Gammaproteobacteria bacterium]
MTFSAHDYQYMSRAIELAKRGLYTTHPNPRVGCVLVNEGRVVGEGWHERAGAAHAEINALKAAGDKAKGATAYVTLEPCCHYGRTPPCSEALIQAGITRVVAAMQDPNVKVAGKGLLQLQAAGIETAVGLLAAEAEALNPGFVKRMRRGRPYVRAKMAMSLDGRTAMASGESAWITGEAARQDVQHWRARADCIMTGIGTVLQDDPRLNVRLPGFDRQPLRVVVDSTLRMRADCTLLAQAGKTLVFTCAADATLANAEVETVAAIQGRVDLGAVLDSLARRDINEVHLECGATLSGAMLQAGLIDELVIYMAPVLLGDAGRGLFHLPGLERMADRLPLEIFEQRQVGRDWRLRARVVSAADAGPA